jgi:hypothetical protein
MPLSKDPLGGGTNADGSRSGVYCSHCYVEGRFTLPDITVDEMRARVQDKLKEFGFPRLVGRFMTRNLGKLARWSRPVSPSGGS